MLIGIFDSTSHGKNHNQHSMSNQMSNQTGSRSIDRGRKILSNSVHQRSLERIIQRDYFPDAEIEPQQQPETDTTTASLQLPRSIPPSSLVVQCDDDSHKLPNTLTSFHAVTTSCETEKWKRQHHHHHHHHPTRTAIPRTVARNTNMLGQTFVIVVLPTVRNCATRSFFRPVQPLR
jgi:hypothetical protein